ncbi:MAG TPA: S8 family serine peptidase [Candidatus Acidoferrales bacterium]|nr:S8 family serine peptidase [Candidatus Acidoferrales bacterium]
MFYKVFYGAAVTVPRAMMPQIAQLSYVKKVYIDEPMKATLEQSVHQIRADSVWTKFGTKGDSVLVGIIDTGIDYTDSALGGGIGPGFKVVGGYNFINDTPDPMDDNGHGTHVAGIIAADGGGLEGVAPHAKLMALKVLDQYGGGTESTVIAGIERAVDPDNDGNDSDKVDVVNMSLGGPGNPDDPLSIAVDNAVKLAITFCIAAGNSGSFFGIGSPGAARLAITVGAVDSLDELAMFSSKGPDSTIYSIKPDVLAPGVNILSTFTRNTVFTLSGTSMATPFVTGVCTLLKSLHRNWPPATIKSAITTTAVDIDQDVMVQGAGRIDALSAAEVSSFVYPSELSFGFDSSSFSIWTIVDTMWVSNVYSQSQSFTMSFNNLLSGVSITANPSTFSLASNDSQMVMISLQVNNPIVPYPSRASSAYSGEAFLYGSKDTLHIPWAFVKMPRILFTFDLPGPTFVLTDSDYGFTDANATWNDQYNAQLQMPNGNYDLAALFNGTTADHLVVEEHIPIANVSHIYVSSAGATNSILFHALDINGQPLNTYPSTTKMLALNFPDLMYYNVFGFCAPLSDTVYCSNYSDNIWLSGAEFANDANSLYSVQFDSVSRLEKNITLSNVPSDFYAQSVHVDFPPYSEGASKEMDCWNLSLFTNPLTGQVEFYGGSMSKITSGFKGDWSGDLYLTKDRSERFAFPLQLMALDSTQADSATYPEWLQTPLVKVIDDSIEYFGTGEPFPRILSPSGGYSDIGHTPFFIRDWFMNENFTQPAIIESGGYFGEFDESLVSTGDSAFYSIYNDQGSAIASGVGLGTPGNGITVPPGAYTFQQTTHNYFLRGVQGAAALTAKFDFRRSDPNPPMFTSIRLLNSKDIAVDSLSKNEKGTLMFSALDMGPVVRQFGNLTYIKFAVVNSDSTKLFYKVNGTSNWVLIPVTKVYQDTLDNIMYSADITPTSDFDSAGIDLKIDVQDQSGNTSEWLMEPGYCIGRYGALPRVKGNPEENSTPTVFALYQNYPNPFNPTTIINYQLAMNSFVTMKVYDVLGREVKTLVSERQTAGNHAARFDARSLPSGVYFCRLEAGSFSDTKKLLLLK